MCIHVAVIFLFLFFFLFHLLYRSCIVVETPSPSQGPLFALIFGVTFGVLFLVAMLAYFLAKSRSKIAAEKNELSGEKYIHIYKCVSPFLIEYPVNTYP